MKTRSTGLSPARDGCAVVDLIAHARDDWQALERLPVNRHAGPGYEVLVCSFSRSSASRS